MTMTMIECYGQCYGRNLIDAEGFCSPFVFCGDDGRIYVGDSDNLDSFATVDEAIARCNSYILSGERLERAKRAHENDSRDNAAAEYHWHCDAQMQLDALRRLKTTPASAA